MALSVYNLRVSCTGGYDMDYTITKLNLQPEQKKELLFRNQKNTLDTFLSTGAITKEQYDVSLSVLIEKMNITPEQLALWV